MSFLAMSDQAVAKTLGERLEQLRLEHNLTQQQVADEIGLSRLSYRKLEAGEGKLVNFISALRVLGRLDALELVLPEEPFSPLQQLQRKGKARKRASGVAPESTHSETANEQENNELDW